ncbi:hypothetical protein Q9966_010868 [Columba livia]|nr:hypothetical protein Q9966_010868 [Columba livia]
MLKSPVTAEMLKSRYEFLENMKKPWSPDLPVDNQSYNSDFTSVPDREGEKELALDGTEEKKEREKKHTNFTLCNVCNIQLNSAAQAQIHYNGKSHQKRLKQLSNGNLKSDNEHSMLCSSPAIDEMPLKCGGWGSMCKHKRAELSGALHAEDLLILRVGFCDCVFLLFVHIVTFA